VYAVYKEFKIELIHPFYDKSKRLFDVLKKKIKKRVGVTTLTVEREATSVLAKAVRDQLTEKAKKDPSKKALLFEYFAIFCDRAFDNIDKNISVLLREPVPVGEKNRKLEQVTEMYEELMERGKVASPETYARQMIRSYAPKKLKKTAYKIYLNEAKKTLKQIIRLRKKPVEPSDMEILAEAAYLKEYYEKRQEVSTFFLASTDYHFSPCKFNGRESRIISDEIKNRFGIICDWPDVIARWI
jgi:hypothetical protein